MSYAKAHADGFGSAEIAAVVGIDHYCSTIEVVRRKRALRRGEAVDEKEESFAMLRGRLLEPAIMKMLEHRTGIEFEKPSEPIIDRLAIVRPDGIGQVEVLDDTSRDPGHQRFEPPTMKVSAEVKSPGPMMALKFWDEDGTGADGVPDETILQSVWQAGAANCDAVRIGALIGGFCRVYSFPFDRGLYDSLQERAAWAWKFVEEDRDPPADGGPAATEFLGRELSVPHPGVWLKADAEDELIIDDYLRAHAAFKKVEQAKQEAANLLKQKIGDNPGMICRGGAVHFTANKDKAAHDVVRWEDLARFLGNQLLIKTAGGEPSDEERNEAIDTIKGWAGEFSDHIEARPSGIRPLRPIMKKGQRVVETAEDAHRVALVEVMEMTDGVDALVPIHRAAKEGLRHG